MKTTETIKSLLFVGVVSLTLASCGGGGGGGGGGESHSSGSDYTGDSSSDSSSHSLAPDSLSVGQTFTATISGQTYTLPISSASTSGGVTTGRVQYQGYNRAFRYEKTGSSTATFRWCVDTQTGSGLAGTGVTSAPSVTATHWKCECNFTSPNSGNISQVRLVTSGNYSGTLSIEPVLPGKSGTFQITGTPSGGNSSSNSSSSSSSSGNSSVNNNYGTTQDYAPSSISGMKLKSSYESYSFSGSSITHEDEDYTETGSYSYEKLSSKCARISYRVSETGGGWFESGTIDLTFNSADSVYIKVSGTTHYYYDNSTEKYSNSGSFSVER